MRFSRVLVGLSNDISKICFGHPLALFQKIRVLGDLAKIAITWPLGNFWSRLFAPKSFAVFAL